MSAWEKPGSGITEVMCDGIAGVRCPIGACIVDPTGKAEYVAHHWGWIRIGGKHRCLECQRNAKTS